MPLNVNSKFILIYLCFVFNNIFAQSIGIDSTSNNLIIKGIHQVHLEEYDDALETFTKLINLYPENIAGYFYTAATYQTIMRNYRINSYEPLFRNYLDLAIEKGEESLKKNRKDIFSHFYLGGAYGFRGLHKVRKRDWLGALRDGLKGIGYLERVVSVDPDMYDAYLGLGVFHYWRTVKTKMPGFLSFVKKDRQRGIREVLLTINKGEFTKTESRYSLVEIYFNSGDYEKALEVNQALFDAFPSNPACLYMRMRIFEKLERWKEAENVCRELLEHLKSCKYKCTGYMLECYYNLALCCYKSGDFVESLEAVQKALDLKDKRDKSKEIEGPLEDYDEIIKMSEELYEDIHKNPDNK